MDIYAAADTSHMKCRGGSENVCGDWLWLTSAELNSRRARLGISPNITFRDEADGKILIEIFRPAAKNKDNFDNRCISFVVQ